MQCLAMITNTLLINDLRQDYRNGNTNVVLTIALNASASRVSFK